MANPFLAEIRIFAGNFAPTGWALCDGQLMAISQNTALFSLLGTTYGGDGKSTFGLPNLQGRVPMHVGNGLVLGQSDGEENHTLTLSEMPAHSHPANCNSAPGTQASPSSGVWAADPNGNAPYSSSDGSGMAIAAINNAGGSQPHNNLAPFLTLNFVIALQGIFPSRN